MNALARAGTNFKSINPEQFPIKDKYDRKAEGPQSEAESQFIVLMAVSDLFLSAFEILHMRVE